jgi:dihydroorotate dehydrogenase
VLRLGLPDHFIDHGDQQQLLRVAGLDLRNPVMTASGTFGYGEEFSEYVDLTRLGAYITKGLCLHPRTGNPTPRIVETPGGMLNAIGPQNVGIDAFIEKKSKHPMTPQMTTIMMIDDALTKMRRLWSTTQDDAADANPVFASIIYLHP